MAKKIISEKTLEAGLVIQVTQMGGWCIKQTAQYHRGLPDRLVLMPQGKTYFAEIKTTGRKPTALQAMTHTLLRDLGYPVAVIDSKETLDAFVASLKRDQAL